MHPTVLRVDIPSEHLAALHQTLAVDCSAFITAWNPLSQLSDAAANERQQRRLERFLAARGWSAIDGVGQHPSQTWAGEPSFLVPGMPLRDACDAARLFRQNAIVWSGPDATPRLILLR
jgi:hypothetical protein